MVVCDLTVALIFYVLLRPVSKNLSLLAAFFRLSYAAIDGINGLTHFAVVLLLGGAGYLKAFETHQLDWGGADAVVARTNRNRLWGSSVTRRISNETQRYVNHRVSALDPLLYVSPDGRHRPRDGARNAFKPHCGAHPGRVAVRNAGAGRKAIGIRDHPPRVAPWVGRPCHPHEGGGGRRRDRQVQRSLLLYLDTPRARRYRALLRHPRSARVMGASATADRRAAQTRYPCLKRCSRRFTKSNPRWVR